MILISHRGNIDGKTDRENEPSYILEAVEKGYSVEFDVWYIENEWYLGHDEPTYKIEESFLENIKFWCHAKNMKALEKMSNNNKIHSFWHQEDDYTLTSKNYIWTYPGKLLSKNSICVLPEMFNSDITNCLGICSDVIKNYK